MPWYYRATFTILLLTVVGGGLLLPKTTNAKTEWQLFIDNYKYFFEKNFRNPGDALQDAIDIANNPEEVVEGAKIVADSVVAGPFADIKLWFITLSLDLIALLANGVYLLLYICSNAMGSLLGLGKFITNSYVQTGWPFVQGIANLGFIFALLFIAFATTLQIDLGGGIKRLLPRLLFAAVMINFSLVIGGVLIDISRVVMAILIRAIGDCSLYDVGACLLEKSHLFQLNFTLNNGAWLPIERQIAVPTGWNQVVKALFVLLVSLALAVGMLMVTIGLFVRYIMLTLLLIVSPIAYLSLAFPGLQGYSKKWWSSFLQYVFYGPVALFILIMAMSLTDGAAAFDQIAENAFLDTVLHLAIILALLFAAYKYSKAASGSFAAAAMSIASKEAWKRPGTTGAVAGGIMTGGIGGILAGAALGKLSRYGAETARDQARDASGVIRTGIRERAKATPVLKAFVPAKRNEKGELKEGQNSVARQAARWLTGATGFNPKEAQNQQRRQDMRNAGTDINNRAFEAGNLRRKEVGEVLSKPQIDAVIEDAQNSGNFERLLALVRNPNAVDNMSPKQQIDINNLTIGDIRQRRAGQTDDQLTREVREVKRALDSSINTVDKW